MQTFEEVMTGFKGKTTGVNKKFVVSTVQLPVEAYGPEIYESMVFRIRNGKPDFQDLDCERYDSKESAARGHELMVAKWELLDIAGKADDAYYPDALEMV